jgi:adenylosuccinate lyase
VIARRVADLMPFLATERLLMRGVRAGGDRQRLHEVIRGHSLATARAIAEDGAPNELLSRLAADPAFSALGVAARPDEIDPAAYVGRAPAQVDEYLSETLAPLIDRIQRAAPVPVAAEVTV